MSENKKEKKPNKLIKIILVALIVILAGGAGVFVGAKFLNTSKAATTTSATAAKPATPKLTINTDTSTVNTDTKYSYEISKYTYQISDDFLVNLANTDSKRYLKTKIYIGYDNSKMASELSANKAVIRDAINSVLRTKKAEDITPKGVEDLKKEILDRISPIFQNGKPNNIYFYDILVQ